MRFKGKDSAQIRGLMANPQEKAPKQILLCKSGLYGKARSPIKDLGIQAQKLE